MQDDKYLGEAVSVLAWLLHIKVAESTLAANRTLLCHYYPYKRLASVTFRRDTIDEAIQCLRERDF